MDLGSPNLPSTDPATWIYVCTTCNDRRAGPGGRAGARLYADLSAQPSDPRIRVAAVECLSVCRPSCALSYAAPGKWTYVFNVPPATTIAAIFAGARLYDQSPTGVIPWSLRPAFLKEGVVARVPPFSTRDDTFANTGRAG